MAATLPVALYRDRAVKRAVVIIGRLHRIAQSPQPECRARQIPSEAYQPRMRTPAFAGKIGERDLECSVAARIRLDQHLLDHFEVAAFEREVGERFAPVEPEAARNVAHG